MKRLITGLATLLMLAASGLSAQESIETMERKFRDIPESQPLAVYWYWVAGNMSKEGVVKDLEAMKAVGINRVQIGMIGEGQGAPQGPVRMFTDEWWEILHTMFKRAGELDIEVGLFNCPGWSQSGGPWVKPSQAMRYLGYAKDTLSGPVKYSTKLPEVGEDAQEVKVLAFPLMESSVAFKASGNVAKQKEITLKADKKGTVRSVNVIPSGNAGATGAELFVREKGHLRSVGKFSVDRSNPAINVGFVPFAPVIISIPETEGDEFVLKVDKEGIVGDVVLSDVPAVERYAEKSLAKMWQTPHPMWDAYIWRDQPENCACLSVQPDAVQDLSSLVAADGTLTWDVPKGKWVVMRTAMLPTGSMDAPAPKEGEGLETDKMSKKHIRAHFDNYLGVILDKIPAADRKTFKVVVEDSYETGGQNWTDDLIDDFKKAYGYDPVPYIPVLSGVVIGSQDISDRFLWDLRRLVADEVSYNYVGGLREVSHEHGLTTWLENYGHWGFPGEFLQYGGQSDEIAGEFWSFGDLGDIENRVASSCGHIYGKQRVWAESFTCGGPDFTQYPGQMKQRGDRFFTEGINASLMHLYIQQPDDRVPGINAWFGNEFNRNNTWFSHMDVFGQYLKRCNYMLQQGRYVADVAYFLGEDAPKMTGTRDPEIPEGYSYDYVNAEVLMDATVKDGKLHLKSGMEYAVLVLPKIKTMRPELLEKIERLVADGMTLLGPAPEKSPSLQDYPAADRKVRETAARMWQTSDQPFAASVRYGKGRIYRAASLEQIFADKGIVADFTTEDPALPLQFIHLTHADGDVYFVSNQSDKAIAFDGIFRNQGKAPELWNPLTSEVRFLPEYKTLSKTTKVPMALEPFDSAFIVFRKGAQAVD
ncbi:MAG: glycoside hydrolase family 2, partial [Bacteroidales bacterium]|nr:glycoside hydrolase family 2 [Bacteroidales bacterium]